MQGVQGHKRETEGSVYLKSKSVVRYMVMPEVFPRLRRLFRIRTFIPFLLAQLFLTLKLIEAQDIYTMSVRDGRVKLFPLFQIAYGRLIFDRHNLDKTLLYFGSLIGVMCAFAYVASLFLFFIVSPAYAQLVMPAALFHNNSSDQDIAFMLMDSVFGVPDMFNSVVATSGTASGTWPSNYHYGLQAMFQLYNYCFLVVAVFIMLYHVLAAVLDTAMTGKPFGQKFDAFFAPIRMVIAIGLLLPVSSGLNVAQFVVLHVAKAGSNFATNGFVQFNASTGGNPLGSSRGELVYRPNAPDITEIVKFVHLTETCRLAYRLSGYYVQAYIKTASGAIPLEKYSVQASADVGRLNYVSFEDVASLTGRKDIHIVFGMFKGETPDNSYKYYDTVMGASVVPRNEELLPVCGQITLPFLGVGDDVYRIQEGYLNLINHLQDGDMHLVYYAALSLLATYEPAREMVRRDEFANLCAVYFFDPGMGAVTLKGRVALNGLIDTDGDGVGDTAQAFQVLGGWANLSLIGRCSDESLVSTLYLAEARDRYQLYLSMFVHDAVQDMRADPALDVTSDMVDRGWAGSGIWFNRLAQVNGRLVSSVSSLPFVSAFPLVMEDVQNHNKKYSRNVSGTERFNPSLGQEDLRQDIVFTTGIVDDRALAVTFHEVAEQLFDNTISPNTAMHGNYIERAADILIGGGDLFRLRKNMRSGTGERVHPLVQMVAAGRGLMDAALRNLGISVVVSAGTMLAGLIEELPAELVQAFGSKISEFTSTLASLTLTAGFILYYVVPFLPFLYFFFAVGDWVKSIFEALIGAPLWAISHISSASGEGIIDRGSLQGYMLLLEIFMRPIMTVFGLLAAVVVYSALVTVLNEIMDVIAGNAFNYGNPENAFDTSIIKRGIDHIFLTLMYVILAYIMALSCFKLINEIPDGLLRWTEVHAKSFSDMTGDPAEKLTANVAYKGSQYLETAAGVVTAAPGAMMGLASRLGSMGDDVASASKSTKAAGEAGGKTADDVAAGLKNS